MIAIISSGFVGIPSGQEGGVEVVVIRLTIFSFVYPEILREWLVYGFQCIS